MELTGLQIFKYLPAAKKAENSNCKKCGCATCMAFALKLAKKQIAIDKCPCVPDELKSVFCEASKIQQHQVPLSEKLTVGGETVMFRHDKTFVSPTVVAVEMHCNDNKFDEKLAKFSLYETERIGETFKLDAVRLKGDCTSEEYKSCVEKIKKVGLAVIEDNSENYSVVRGNDFSDLVLQAKNALTGTKNSLILELDFGSKSASEVVQELTYIRRSAILHRFEPLTYPVMVQIPDSYDVNEVCAIASLLVCRYASIIVLSEEHCSNNALLSTIFTLRQGIYTNPQKPLQVEAKVYEFNEPDENAPILLTTNFALTYFAVAGELEQLPFGSYLVVTPSDGMSVLTAWSADKFTAELVAKSVKNYDLLNKVKTRAIIIPGLLSHMREELQEVLPEWKIVVGTVEACQIPEFLKQIENR